jgi:biopolymer transport protein ExbB
MEIKMKYFTKATAALIGSAVMLTAMPASAQISSVGQLLDKVRQDSAKQAAENQAREAKFRERRNQQSALLSQARGELATLERKQIPCKAHLTQIRAVSRALRASLSRLRVILVRFLD